MTNFMRLDNKVALITGGGSGIGAASAMLMSELGAKVVIAGIPALAIEDVAAGINARGGEALAIETDVTKEADVSEAVREAVAQFGRLDVVVANAGIQRHQTDVDLPTLSEGEWETTQDVNLMGIVRTCKHGLARMVEQGEGGAIIIMSSITAISGTSPNVAYMTGKAGLLGLNRHIAVHYGKHGIRCNAICPGALEQTPDWADHPDPDGRKQAMTASIPLGRLGTPQDIAGFVAFLACDAASYANGAHFVVDGGFTVR